MSAVQCASADDLNPYNLSLWHWERERPPLETFVFLLLECNWQNFLAVLYTWQLRVPLSADSREQWRVNNNEGTNNPRSNSRRRAETKGNFSNQPHRRGRKNPNFKQTLGDWAEANRRGVMFGCQRPKPTDCPRCSPRCPHSYLSDTHSSSAPVSSPSNSEIRLLSPPRGKIWPQSRRTNGAGKPLSRHLRWTKSNNALFDRKY